ncbi:MAG: cysteine synthase A [Victivallales bacterium]|nr:cysteine synthase A [Victivallales bacterium]
MKCHDNITETIGNTPTIRIHNFGIDKAVIVCKLEYFNPMSSVKDRIALEILEQAIKSGKLKRGGIIIEATSGNTGLGLAMVAASRGFKLIITMPESMSVERRKLLTHLGAKLVLTPAKKGMSGAVAKAEELGRILPGAFIPRQFENAANPAAHFKTTGPEIWRDTDGKVDIFVAGVGTGGTLSGTGSFLKKQNPAVKVIAVEPDASAVLSGASASPHCIQGIGAGCVTKVYKKKIVDEIIKVKDKDALEYARKAAKAEGILCGISGGANLYAACLLARRPENEGKLIVTLAPDTGERYISTELFEYSSIIRS